MGLLIRPAEPGDVDAAVPLIYSSGPDAFDFVFGDAPGFLRLAYLDGGGEFGHRNHTVAVEAGAVVGIGAAYFGGQSIRFMLATARQIVRHYRLSTPRVMARGLRVERAIPPPKGDVQYIGHLGVEPSRRGAGVGTKLIEHFVERAREEDLPTAQLDVAVTNARAEALYERLGFRVTVERASRLPSVPDHRRMVLEL